MTIHSEHPFLPPEGERDPLRRLRGRLPSPVSVWTSRVGARRAGWTVSSLLIADGQPGEVIGLVDEDSDLWELARQTRVFVVNVLSWQHRNLADAFAGVAPAPGGAFRMASWTETEWGPVLDDAAAWAGVRLADGEPAQAGWGLLVRARIEQLEIRTAGESDEGSMAYLRGRYRQLG